MIMTGPGPTSIRMLESPSALRPGPDYRLASPADKSRGLGKIIASKTTMA
jgi:hypothetical protein